MQESEEMTKSMMRTKAAGDPEFSANRHGHRILLLQVAFAMIAAVGLVATFTGYGVYVYALVPIGIWLGILIGRELDSRSTAEERQMTFAKKLVAAPILTGSAVAVLAATIGSVLLR